MTEEKRGLHMVPRTVPI